ncbi:FAD-dependent thymidylate synthase [Candidatus Micrarchaeota archaeon]|nr:FAD-dependent thymidylate synthase [Candidatus Micrarchaeota archaeon]
MDDFTEHERKLLEPYVTNLDRSIFVLTNLPEVVKGALFSRYSRSAKSLRRVLLDEFMLSDELGSKEMFGSQHIGTTSSGKIVQTKKAEEFYDRVLVGYGDDSVAELAGAHIAVEEISIIATKVLEDARIGLSPLEKSTRYVYFDEKKDGKWKYYREPTIMNSEFAALYEETCDLCFQTYTELVPKVSEFIVKREPKDETTSDRAYKASVRAKTCDLLRGLLPAGTLTNMGFFGDGRAYEYLLTRMYGDDLVEMQNIAKEMQGELAKVIPSFVKRANNAHGIATQGFYKRVRNSMEKLAADSALRGTGNDQNEYVRLVEYDKDAERKIIAGALYPYLQKSMREILAIVDKMTDAEKEIVIATYVNERENRRQKPGRGFEHAQYTFDISGNFGAYRDLHRHRMLTQQRQLLTPHLGYKLPKELKEAGPEFETAFVRAMDAAKIAYQKIAAKYPKEAQYVVPLAYNIRWYMSLNLREAYHMLELRSAMQGHIDYRVVAQQMFREIERVHPRLAKGMKFMDMKEYSLERLEAEKRIDKKMDEITKKYGT